MDELLDILRGLHPDTDFENCSDLIDSGILDSFDIISLIAEIDTQFGVRIPAEEIIPENFNSASALHSLIIRLADD